MADIYSVAPSDIAADLPALFPSGFSGSTRPTDTVVTGWISEADADITLQVLDSAGLTPTQADIAYKMGKQYIRYRVEAQVMRAVYAGQAPQFVSQASKPLDDLADKLMIRFQNLQSQAVGDGSAGNRVRVQSGLPDRAGILDDSDLDDEFHRSRKF